jgi:succinate dehydrogenase/fumarate reductase flavoprotein subunit
METKMANKRVSTDVLCIGGGPSGLMAAIRAADMGVKVLVAEKGNTLHSGNGSGGNDHFECYIPEVHGPNTKAIIGEFLHAPVMSKRAEFGQPWLENSFEMVKLWESWGLPMKYKGKWEFAGHAFPGRPRIFLKYTGGEQKRVLTEQALKRGVKIMNRISVFELLKNGNKVVGALGYDTWKDQVIEFRAKAVFLGTGSCSRLYLASTPAWLFNIPFNPMVTGDGRAMVYRAGGELVNIEITAQWAGPKYFARAGKSTWIGVYRGPDDKPIGPFVTKPDKIYGDITADCWTTVFDDYMKSGRGPVYNDVRGASKEDIQYMIHWLRNEGNEGLIRYMEEEGIDLSKNAVEFRTYEMGVFGGILYDAKGITSLPGLFAAVEECGGGMGPSVVFGWLAGESAAKYAKKADFGDLSSEKEKIESKSAMLSSILSREEGATWREANIALQQIMSEYCGAVRSETLLEQGLRNLDRLQQKVAKTLLARNSHELGRCLEVLNLLEVGKVVMLSARERKETRGRHFRPDYPFTNPLMDKLLIIKEVNGKPALTWRETNKD